MYSKAFNRHRVPKLIRAVEPNGRSGIPRNDGRAGLFEAMILMSTVAVLAVALGLSIGVPLALMLREFCNAVAC